MMKNFIGTLCLILVFSSVWSQKIFSTQYDHQTQLKVFVVQYEHQADLKVFKVEYEHQANLKIFFVQYQHQAGWREKSKMHLMY